MKIYARKINPEYQESPLYMLGEWPEDIILTGNRDFAPHTNPVYDAIMDNYDDMADTWQNYSREYSIMELLREYGFEREDGKPWTTKQRHTWRLMMESDASADDDDIILMALELITGHKWAARTLHGYCQGDWQSIYYNVDAWTHEAISVFEIEYFNMGSEWMIHDDDTKPETPEDISGYTMYCYGWNDDEIREEIAAINGVKPEDVVLYKFTVYSRNELYEIA